MATAGYHKVDITPATGMPLAGYAAREHPCAGVHDPLYARALVIEDAGRALAFVSLDVLGVSAPFVGDVRARIADATGMPPGAIMISATHTHAGPVTVSTFFNPGESLDVAYMTRLAEAITTAAASAWTSRRPARVGIGTVRVAGIANNRRTPDRLPVDEDAGFIRVDDPDGRTRAVLVNYACHPTVLGSDNRLASGDFPAFMVDRLEERLGDGAFAMFVNGAQGNVSVGHSSELSAIGVVTAGRTFARAAEIGHQLADAVAGALPSVATAPDIELSWAGATLDLPFKAYPPVSETDADLQGKRAAVADLERRGAPSREIAAAKTERLYASITNFYAAEAAALDGRPLSIELQAFRLGHTLVAAVPLEVFVEIGLRVKREIAHPVLIAGVTNGYFGYLPGRADYATGGYEVVSAKVTAASEDLLVSGIHALDRRLFPEGRQAA